MEVLIGYPEGVKITRLFYGVGVPVDRLRSMVEDLYSLGLMRKLSDDEGTYYFATPRGLEFLDTYWKMKGFLEIFGEESQSKSRKQAKKTCGFINELVITMIKSTISTCNSAWLVSMLKHVDSYLWHIWII